MDDDGDLDHANGLALAVLHLVRRPQLPPGYVEVGPGYVPPPVGISVDPQRLHQQAAPPFAEPVA